MEATMFARYAKITCTALLLSGTVAITATAVLAQDDPPANGAQPPRQLTVEPGASAAPADDPLAGISIPGVVDGPAADAPDDDPLAGIEIPGVVDQPADAPAAPPA